MATDTQTEQDRIAEQVAATEHATRPNEAAGTHAAESEMFRYSAFVHVGAGAEACEEGEDGSCANPLHFHVWVRLPNKFQHQDIREKGNAAKARRMRALRDESTDSYAILEGELSMFTEGSIDILIDELLQIDWMDDYQEAMVGIDADQEKWGTIHQDREEFERQMGLYSELPEDEQPEDFKVLAARVNEYIQAVKDAVLAIQGPRRDELKGRGLAAVVDLVRKARIENSGDRFFTETYNKWLWYICTLTTKRNPGTGMPFERKWATVEDMDNAAPEAVVAVEEAFKELSISLQRGLSGNS